MDALRAHEEAERAREDTGAVPAEFDLLHEDCSQRDGTGETRRTLLWIWTVEGVRNIDSDDVSDDILRAEWAKSCARANRSREEVSLLKEEMRRTIESLEWWSQWWKDKPTSWPGVLSQLSEGMKAYAVEQAGIQKDLADSFELLWETPLADFDIEAETESDIPNGVDIPTQDCNDDDNGDIGFSDDEAIAEDLPIAI